MLNLREAWKWIDLSRSRWRDGLVWIVSALKLLQHPVFTSLYHPDNLPPLVCAPPKLQSGHQPILSPQVCTKPSLCQPWLSWRRSGTRSLALTDQSCPVESCPGYGAFLGCQVCPSLSLTWRVWLSVNTLKETKWIFLFFDLSINLERWRHEPCLRRIPLRLVLDWGFV